MLSISGWGIFGSSRIFINLLRIGPGRAAFVIKQFHINLNIKIKSKINKMYYTKSVNNVLSIDFFLNQ